MSRYEQIQDKIAAQEAAKARAKAIVEAGEDLAAAVHTQVGQIVSSEIGKILDVLHEAKFAIEANPDKNPAPIVVKWIDKMSNKLSIMSASYRSGALPKDDA